MNCMIVCRSNSLHSYLPNKPSKLGSTESDFALGGGTALEIKK